MRGELVEVDGVVDLGELVVQQRRVAAREHALGLARMSAPSPCSPGAPSSRKRSSARACATRSRGSSSSAVWKTQHVAQRLAQAPAGQGVVADVGDAVRRASAARQTASRRSRTAAGTHEYTPCAMT